MSKKITDPLVNNHKMKYILDSYYAGNRENLAKDVNKSASLVDYWFRNSPRKVTTETLELLLYKLNGANEKFELPPEIDTSGNNNDIVKEILYKLLNNDKKRLAEMLNKTEGTIRQLMKKDTKPVTDETYELLLYKLNESNIMVKLPRKASFY